MDLQQNATGVSYSGFLRKHLLLWRLLPCFPRCGQACVPKGAVPATPRSPAARNIAAPEVPFIFVPVTGVTRRIGAKWAHFVLTQIPTRMSRICAQTAPSSCSADRFRNYGESLTIPAIPCPTGCQQCGRAKRRRSSNGYLRDDELERQSQQNKKAPR